MDGWVRAGRSSFKCTLSCVHITIVDVAYPSTCERTYGFPIRLVGSGRRGLKTQPSVPRTKSTFASTSTHVEVGFDAAGGVRGNRVVAHPRTPKLRRLTRWLKGLGRYIIAETRGKKSPKFVETTRVQYLVHPDRHDYKPYHTKHSAGHRLRQPQVLSRRGPTIECMRALYGDLDRFKTVPSG